MSGFQNKRIQNLESKMKEMTNDPVRLKVLESAKQFKTSWVELGQALFTVWRDKLYKTWGYQEFDTYTSKEIGIRKQTAMKLLRSYYFLEKEEPDYLKKDYSQPDQTAKIPSYESVNLLRMAKSNKNLDEKDYSSLKKQIFQDGKDVSDVKKDLTALIRVRKELDPQEAQQEKRFSVLKRFIGSLKSIKREIEVSNILPESINKDIDDLIDKIEAEIG